MAKTVLTSFNALLQEDWVKQGKCRAIFKTVTTGKTPRRFLLGFERTSKRSREYRTKYMLPQMIDFDAYVAGVHRKIAEDAAVNAKL